MNKQVKLIVYDQALQIEAYHFKGIAQPFPDHFHDYYVIGLIEKGKRILTCQNQEYFLRKGNIIIFNPHDSHGCVQCDEENFNYRALNISTDVMKKIVKEITGQNQLPHFKENVIDNEDISYYFKKLHQMMMNSESNFEKEECLFLMMTLLLHQYGELQEEKVIECRKEVELVCLYLEENYNYHISLEDVCHYVQLSQSTLLRAFAQSKGITPYRYLLTLRINKAKILLEQGIQPIDVAMQVGFSDQSHFTHCFSRLIGVSPGMYRDIFIKKQGEK